MRAILQYLSTRPFQKGLYGNIRKLSAVSSVIVPDPIIIKTNRRFQHNFSNAIKSGPGLKDFIVNNETHASVCADAENVPYLDDLDLDGQGRKVYFEIQGCQMNTNDAEVVWAILKKKNYLKAENLSEADVVLIVTCAIRESAETKIWDKLIRLNFYKKQHRFKIGILGCMAERLKQKVLDINKSVDLVAGPDSYKDLPRLLALTRCDQKAVNVLLSLDETYADVMPVRLNESSKSAYISIMRGCDNMCTYCIVPFTRGRERSRPISSILDEVRQLSDQGVKEIVLLGQNVNSYRDMSSAQTYNMIDRNTSLSSEGFKTVYKPKIGGTRFDVLLDKVSEINPEMRVRFTSPHPKDFPDEVLTLIKERKNICCQMHLPVQSGSTSVLERMRRGYTREAYLDLVSHIRSVIPEITLSNDMICGFCGETDEEHQDTISLLEEVKYNVVFMYPYSMREKTTAHRRYKDDVPQEIKSQRVLEVRQVFRKIASEIHQKYIGDIQLILVEGRSKRSEDDLAGRNDGNIKVIFPKMEIPVSPGSQDLSPIQNGDFIAVKINGASSQVLKGVPLYHSSITKFCGESNETFSHVCKY